MQNLTLEGKITLAFPKIIFLVHVMTLSTEIFRANEKIQKRFLFGTMIFQK